MHHTKLGTNVRDIQGNEWVSYGQRVGNMTVNKYYRIEYPKDIQ